MEIRSVWRLLAKICPSLTNQAGEADWLSLAPAAKWNLEGKLCRISNALVEIYESRKWQSDSECIA